MRRVTMLLLLLAGCASIPNTEAVRRAIQKEIDDSVEATRSEDIVAYMESVPPDLIIKEDDGSTMSRDQLRENALRQWELVERTNEIWNVIDRLKVKGDRAKVWTHQLWDRQILGRNGHSTPRLVTTQRQRENWQRRNGRWWQYDIEELGGTVTLDGVPQSNAPK